MRAGPESPDLKLLQDMLLIYYYGITPSDVCHGDLKPFSPAQSQDREMTRPALILERFAQGSFPATAAYCRCCGIWYLISAGEGGGAGISAAFPRVGFSDPG